jgi:F-type H+-transporting ATPase subunit a
MYHFSWFQLISPVVHGVEALGGSHHDGIAVTTSWGICLFLLAMAAVARAGLSAVRARGGSAQYVPGQSLGVAGVFELYVGAILGMVEGTLGKADARRYFWLLGAVFLYIFVSNLMSVLPGGLPPTDNINTNAAMAIVVVLVYVFEGIRRTGAGFFKHMMGPVWWLAPLIFAIEALGVFAIRPMSLSLRLFGNITGDHMVFGIMSDQIPVLVPSIFLGLGIWVSFLQAFVFTLLSAVYIMLSVGHDEDDHH